jgi:hypothetical protein
MKLFISLLLCTQVVFAQDLLINKEPLGSGTPVQVPDHITVGNEIAVLIVDNMYFIPHYLADTPTSANIWARTIQVECERTEAGIVCDGFNWSPSMGRGEFLYITPHIKEAILPKIDYEDVPVPPIIDPPKLTPVPKKHKKKFTCLK